MSEPSTLPGITRAAVFLMAVGEEYAAAILKHLEPRDLHRISTTLVSLANIDRNQVSEVLHEFNEQAENQTSMGVDNQDYLRDVLIRALGRDKAKKVMEHVVSSDNLSGTAALKWLDASAIASSLSEEHPQVAALILSSLDPEQAAEVANLLPEALREEALLRVAMLDSIPAGALTELNEVIEKQVLTTTHTATTPKIGGPQQAAEILNLLNPDVVGGVRNKLKEFDPAMAEQIEDLMVVFDNLLKVDDRGIQTLLRQVPSQTLLVALRGADELVRQKLMRNMSKRAAAILLEDLETMAPVRLREVELAQKEILTTLRRLADAGELSLSNGGGDQFV